MTAAPHIAIVILADDDRLLATLPSRLRENAPDIEVVAVLTSWSEFAGLPSIDDLIVLIDAGLDDEPATVDHIKAVRAAGARAIVLSEADDPRAVVHYMAAGADAVPRRSESSRSVIEQIRLAANRARLIVERGD